MMLPRRLASGYLACSVASPLLAPALCAAASPHPGGEQVHQRLREILGRPEFGNRLQNNLWLQFLQTVADVVGWLGGLRAANPLLFWLLVIGCSTLLAVICVHLAWTIRRVLFVDPRLRPAEDQREKRELLSRSYEQEAQRRGQQNDFTEAIRCLFLALVYRFDETGRVLFQRTWTNREYLGLFEDRPAVRTALAVFVDALDLYWYGQLPADKAQYERCWNLYEGLV